MARAAGRAEGKIADYESYRELYGMFAGVERNTIRDDASDAGTLAARIREGLDSGLFPALIFFEQNLGTMDERKDERQDILLRGRSDTV